MLPLRHPWLWMLLGWVLVGGVIFGSVAPGQLVGMIPFSDGFMHAASYGLLMTWFAGLYARKRHVWIALIVFALGIALEFVQEELSYRRFDPEDMVANAVGIGVGLLLSVTLLAGWCQRVEALLGLRHAGH